MRRRTLLALPLGVSSLPGASQAREAPLQCVVPAKSGGGFDLTCALVQAMMPPPAFAVRVVYHPGGIGALTYSEVVRGVRPVVRELVAFSSGTLLNIAQGRFGAWRPDRIRWVAGIALDHGVVAVHRDAPWRSLRELLEAVRARPASIAFATGGTIGSQDWMKAALLARSVGLSHKALRVVAFEGGGDALRALQAGHVQVLCGDAAELSAGAGPQASIRLLAVLSPSRLNGPLAVVPTAVEQGVEVSWPILRGVYASADFPAAELSALIEHFSRQEVSSDPAGRARALGLQPLALAGAALEREVQGQLERFAALAGEFGVTVRR